MKYPQERKIEMKKAAFLTITMLLFITPLSTYAKDKVMAFDVAPEKVFNAALHVAEQHYTVSDKDEKNLVLHFYVRSGRYYPSGAEWHHEWSVSVESDGKGGSKVTLERVTKGIIGTGEIDKYMKQVQEAVEESK